MENSDKAFAFPLDDIVNVLLLRMSMRLHECFDNGFLVRREDERVEGPLVEFNLGDA